MKLVNFARRGKWRAEIFIHILAAFCHGALAALHALGIGYNLKRAQSNPKNWVDVLAHALGETYALWSVKSHAEDVQKLKRKITKSKRRRK